MKKRLRELSVTDSRADTEGDVPAAVLTVDDVHIREHIEQLNQNIGWWIIA